jgi:hypothetical protein
VKAYKWLSLIAFSSSSSLRKRREMFYFTLQMLRQAVSSCQSTFKAGAMSKKWRSFKKTSSIVKVCSSSKGALENISSR